MKRKTVGIPLIDNPPLQDDKDYKELRSVIWITRFNVFGILILAVWLAVMTSMVVEKHEEKKSLEQVTVAETKEGVYYFTLTDSLRYPSSGFISECLNVKRHVLCCENNAISLCMSGGGKKNFGYMLHKTLPSGFYLNLSTEPTTMGLVGARCQLFCQ